MKEIKANPCPFDGRKRLYIVECGPKGYVVGCLRCGGSGPIRASAALGVRLGTGELVQWKRSLIHTPSPGELCMVCGCVTSAAPWAVQDLSGM